MGGGSSALVEGWTAAVPPVPKPEPVVARQQPQKRALEPASQEPLGKMPRFRLPREVGWSTFAVNERAKVIGRWRLIVALDTSATQVVVYSKTSRPLVSRNAALCTRTRACGVSECSARVLESCS